MTQGVQEFYGQNSRIVVLPVMEGWVLRANLKNRHFARNRGLAFTGRFQKSAFCP
ncbi:vitamin B12-binding protein [Ligilactobacillus ruminis]|nr:vitamin B12-binding protein [Ligilactobacillus ruminis]